MTEPHPEDVKQLVRYLRSLHDWTQEELAAAAGLDVSTIGRYESGARIPDREMLERLAAAARVPMTVLWSCLLPAFLAARLAVEDRALPQAQQVSPKELASGIGEACAQVAAPAVAVFEELLAAANEKPWERSAPCGDDRASAAELWQRLAPLAAERRWEVLKEAPSFHTWAVAEQLAHESENAAAGDARGALDLARQAVWLAERVAPGATVWRSRVVGYVTAFLGNALRVASDYPGAREAFTNARRLWRAGAASDPAGLLPEWRLLDLEASLLRDQRNLPEAIELLDRALVAAPPEAASRILLKKAFTLEQTAQFERALATLEEAGLRAPGERRPRLVFGISFNKAVNLVHLGRAEEASVLLPEVRRLAAELANDLDLVRMRWLEGHVDAGLGRWERAIAALEEVSRAFEDRKLPYDFALANLDLSLLYREQSRWPEIQRLATQMIEIFQAQGVHREAVAAVILFREAAVNQAVTVELVRRLKDYLQEAQAAPGPAV